MWQSVLSNVNNSEDLIMQHNVHFQIDQSEESKFHVAVIGNLFATQPIGREISLNVARHLLKGLHFQDPTIVDILSNTVIHIVPVIDRAFEQVKKKNSFT